LEAFFANLGVPAILIAFAILAASKRLSSITSLLVGVTATHFAFIEMWTQMLSMTRDDSPVIGSITVATFAQPSLDLAASCARVWLKFADYAPAAHDQIAGALRWIIGGTV